MLKKLFAKISTYKEAAFFLSLLPVISISVAFYANTVAFRSAEVEEDKSINFLSPLAKQASKNPDIYGASSASAELKDETESESTQISQTDQPKVEKSTPPPITAKTEEIKEEFPAKPLTITAKTNRINFPNNKFGVHIFSNEEDIDLAAQLVNSNGGDWGWVTVTIDIQERNEAKWNSLFSKMLGKHLIPIIQLSNNGKIPSEEEIDGIAGFLSGLGWPTKIRPITIFSEVNASEYWGGKIDPEGYARILNKAIDSFKTKNQEFFIMNGAFNASARTGSSEIGCIKTDLGVDTCYLSETEYLKRMETTFPGILKKLDGWAVHTYPHPAYKGRPTDTRVGAESAFESGRNTIRSYQFELRLLATFGVSLPIFITETGWPHKEGKAEHPEWYDQNTVAEFYRQAFQSIFLPDARVVAVTPFVLKFDNYDNFAFIGQNGEQFPQWNTILSFSKITGSPPIN